MEVIIPEKYVEIKHPILRKECPICHNRFKVGDTVVIVSLQESKEDKAITAIGLPMHKECHSI